MQIYKKIKTENYIDDDLEKGESYADANDETESDIDNHEYDKYFVESILIVVKVYIFQTGTT